VIAVSRLKGGVMFINAELIETVEAVPDTTITLQNGHRYIVADRAEDVIARIVAYRKALSEPASGQAAR
jgi:flagellar protein FlbD